MSNSPSPATPQPSGGGGFQSLLVDPEFQGLEPRKQLKTLQRASGFFRELPLERQVIFLRDVRAAAQPPKIPDQLSEFLQTMPTRAAGTAKFGIEGLSAA